MKNLFLSLSFAVSGLILATTSHADPVVVFKGQAIFIAADDHLTVLPEPNQPLSCSFDFDNGLFIPAASASIKIPLPGAFDVKVIGNDAYVATSTVVDGIPTTDYVKYNVSACLPDVPFTPSVAIADLSAGHLVIPCILVDGEEFNVVMNRRGNSMNWEVIFAEPFCN